MTKRDTLLRLANLRETPLSDPLCGAGENCVNSDPLQRAQRRTVAYMKEMLSLGVPHPVGSETALDLVAAVLSPSLRHMPARAIASVKRPLRPKPSSFQCTVR
jgi:hypothetical protein